MLAGSKQPCFDGQYKPNPFLQSFYNFAITSECLPRSIALIRRADMAGLQNTLNQPRSHR